MQNEPVKSHLAIAITKTLEDLDTPTHKVLKLLWRAMPLVKQYSTRIYQNERTSRAHRHPSLNLVWINENDKKFIKVLLDNELILIILNKNEVEFTSAYKNYSTEFFARWVKQALHLKLRLPTHSDRGSPFVVNRYVQLPRVFTDSVNFSFQIYPGIRLCFEEESRTKVITSLTPPNPQASLIKEISNLIKTYCWFRFKDDPEVKAVVVNCLLTAPILDVILMDSFSLDSEQLEDLTNTIRMTQVCSANPQLLGVQLQRASTHYGSSTRHIYREVNLLKLQDIKTLVTLIRGVIHKHPCSSLDMNGDSLSVAILYEQLPNDLIKEVEYTGLAVQLGLIKVPS